MAFRPSKQDKERRSKLLVRTGSCVAQRSRSPASTYSLRVWTPECYVGLDVLILLYQDKRIKKVVRDRKFSFNAAFNKYDLMPNLLSFLDKIELVYRTFLYKNKKARSKTRLLFFSNDDVHRYREHVRVKFLLSQPLLHP